MKTFANAVWLTCMVLFALAHCQNAVCQNVVEGEALTDGHTDQMDQTNSDGDTDEGDDEEYMTQHQQSLWETEMDFHDVDLTGDADDAALEALQKITTPLFNRLENIFENTHSQECRSLIAKNFGYFVNAIGMESSLPFSDIKFVNECEGEEEYDFNNLPKGVHLGTIQNRTYQPPRNETEYISPSEIVFCYGILAHDSAQATIRFIEAVDEPSTIFVVHIDAKFDSTYNELKKYVASKKHSKIHLLGDRHRVRVNWGGFSMVNATLQMLNFADTLDFTHFVHMASSAYPIASNRRIRNKIASYPKDANFLHIILKPSRPAYDVWHYFVECDDRVHRIYRLPPLRKETHGVELYTSSQWFIISKEFAHYLANPEPESFLAEYLDYIQHAVVADETFFGTVLRNTPFCHKHHNWNFLHLQFDQWENERDIDKRDERKCIMPDPNHCGRSPTTMTLDYFDILELSGDLYARKFSDEVDLEIKDVIDTLRAQEETNLTAENVTEPDKQYHKNVHLLLEGHGTLIVAKATTNDTTPLCLGLGPQKNKVRLVPCFYDDVPRTLAPDWETGGVIMEETLPHNRWEISPCSSDGNLKRMESGAVNVTEGMYSPTGPRCMVRMMDGLRRGRCIDGESLDSQPGGAVHVFPCMKRWSQYLAFGDGKHAPAMSLHTNVPLHIVRRIAETGRVQESYMCLGVAGRGDGDEEDWLQKRSEVDINDLIYYGNDHEDGKTPPLKMWGGKQLIATKCSNADAVIEWVLVPFVEEDEEDNTDASKQEDVINSGKDVPDL